MIRCLCIMNILKYLLIALVVGCVIWLGYFYYQNRRLPMLTEIQSTVTQLPMLISGKLPTNVNTSSLPQISQVNQQAVSEAINQGKERVDMVLGDAIEVASDSTKPAAQKALDYGRYLYCKQVVDEYEAQPQP